MLLTISLVVASLVALGIGTAVFAAVPVNSGAVVCPVDENGYGGGYGRLGQAGSSNEVVAKLLGMTTDQLEAERLQGKSLVQIAATKNVTQTQLVAAIMGAKKASLQESVKAGKLTQERANLMIQQMEQATTQAVTRTTVGPPDNRGSGFGTGKQGTGPGSMRAWGQQSGNGAGTPGSGPARAR
jgi:hypothetical protein